MRITRKSLMSGKLQSMEIPVTELELDTYYSSGANIQDCFPHLTKEQREFIKTGITPDEWATLPREEEDDSEDCEPEEAAMTETLSPSIDAIFWVGNPVGAALVNTTTGRSYALITKTGEVYEVRLFLGWFDRLRFWRRLRSFERRKIAWVTFAYMEVAFECMLEAVTETDQILQALGVIPQRVEPWERYYLLRLMTWQQA